jgi:hypothetical protein
VLSRSVSRACVVAAPLDLIPGAFASHRLSAAYMWRSKSMEMLPVLNQFGELLGPARIYNAPVPVPAPAPTPGPTPVVPSVPCPGSSPDLGNVTQNSPNIRTMPKMINASTKKVPFSGYWNAAPPGGWIRSAAQKFFLAF